MHRLDRATPDDIAAIMAIERRPGYEEVVGRWSTEEHRIQMSAMSGTRYLVAREAEEVFGFVILQGLDDAHRCTTLRRIAVAEAGRGLGAAILAATIDHVFRESRTHRLQLRVYDDNLRAQRAYLRAGFRDEGLIRDMVLWPDGRFRSMHLMSILRPEWAAGQPNRPAE